MWIQKQMSNTSSPRDATPGALIDDDLQELTALLGGPAGEVTRDRKEEIAGALIDRMRALLIRAVNDQKVSAADLAKRLDVDRSLVTRFFRSGKDMKVSTLALMADALDRSWVIELVGRTTERGNGHQVAQPSRSWPLYVGAVQEGVATSFHEMRPAGEQPVFSSYPIPNPVQTACLTHG